MTDDRTITIGVNVDPEGAVSGIEEVEGATVQLADEGGEAGMDFGQAMEVALGNLAADAAAELASQLRGLVNDGMELLSGSLDDANVQRLLDDKLKLSLDNAGGAAAEKAQKLKGLASELQKTTDFSNEQIQAAQSLFITYGASAEGAARLSESVADLATFASAGSERTVSLNRAARTLGRTMDGSTESLQRLGVSLDEATKQEIEAAEGMERIEIVAEAMEEKVGGAAERLSTPWTGLQNDIDDLQKTFGQELIPIAIETSEKLREVAQDEDVKEGIREVAQEVADLLAQGIEMTGRIVGLFAEYREEIGTAADVTFRLVTAVGAYVAGAKAYTLWTNRAVIAQKAATVAQKGLNTALRLNPIGAVVSALTVVLPLLYQFRDSITDAAAAVLDFSANAVRSLQSVVDRLKTLASQIPDAVATGPLAVFKGAVQGLDTAVDASADTMEGWAESLRKVGEESEEVSVNMGEQEGVTFEGTQTTQENTQAQRENAAARREMSSAIREQVEAQNKVLDQGTPGFSKTLVGQADSIRDVRDLLRGGLLNSIQATETAISNLREEYENATGEQRRRDLQALIEKLKKHRDELDVAQKKVQEYGKDLDENLKAEAVDAVEQSFLELGKAIGQSQKTIASFGAAARSILADLASTIAKQLIAMGSAMIIANPAQGGAFIAAGTTLQVISARIRSSQESSPGGDTREPAQPPSFQEGVENFEGGLARVHEDELLVNMAPGTSVLSAMTIPRSPPITTAGIKRAAAGGGATAADIEGLEGKLDEVAQRFEEKQFRLRGRDQVTQQERVKEVYDDAGMR